MHTEPVPAAVKRCVAYVCTHDLLLCLAWVIPSCAWLVLWLVFVERHDILASFVREYAPGARACTLRAHAHAHARSLTRDAADELLRQLKAANANCSTGSYLARVYLDARLEMARVEAVAEPEPCAVPWASTLVLVSGCCCCVALLLAVRRCFEYADALRAHDMTLRRCDELRTELHALNEKHVALRALHAATLKAHVARENNACSDDADAANVSTSAGDGTIARGMYLQVPSAFTVQHNLRVEEIVAYERKVLGAGVCIAGSPRLIGHVHALALKARDERGLYWVYTVALHETAHDMGDMVAVLVPVHGSLESVALELVPA